MRMRFVIFTVAVATFLIFYFGYQVGSSAPKSSQKKIFTELKPQSFQAVAFGVSSAVRDLATASRKSVRIEKTARQVSNQLPSRKKINGATADEEKIFAVFSTEQMPAPLLSFAGISNRDNAEIYGLYIIPPDTNGDVGLNHYVQAVNALVKIFNKQGNALTPPFKMSALFSVLGTPCAQRDDGDPIVLYDTLADRWLLSQFCTNAPPFRQMIAVSKSGDPTGEYYVYEFVMPNVKLNDFPKFGIWTDAIFMTTDEFLGSDYVGSGAFAFDKRKLYDGDASASYIYFNLDSPTTARLGGLLPADLDGLTSPPDGAPGIFAGYMATEYGDPIDAIRLFEFHADFENPSLSIFAESAESPIETAPFDPTSPEGRADILQPPPGEALDSQSDRLMYRAAYRNFGSHESLVLNQTVRISPVGQLYRAGIRIYELRRKGSAFSIHEQATLGENSSSRWIGSAAQDHQGNLAIGYNFVNEEKMPSILYSGKLAVEPAGVFRGETTLINGTGVQTAFGFRWGDYSHMSIDPADDCSFWFTSQYYSAESQEESPFSWLTRIGKFRFVECTDAPRAFINGSVTDAANGLPIANAQITAGAYSRNTNSAGNYENLLVLPGTYELTASAKGFRPQIFSLTIADGQTVTQNFALQPIAVPEISETEITAESCSINNAVEPGETVTINVALRNNGARNTVNLIAALQASEGVLNPSAEQNYGALEAGGASVSRPFTFTAAHGLKCGEPLSLIFELRDGDENLGTVSIKLNTGVRRVVLQENFDSVSAPDLPAGWTTSATGAQQNWTTKETRNQSPPNSVFSPAPNQIGLNELVSPVFQINSTQAEVSFRNWYDLETTFLRNKLYDGSVLEIKIGEDEWRDIEAAGGTFLEGGYDGVLDNCCQNPLAGRRAWSGRSGINQTPEFITSRAKLPASAAGQQVQLRWRIGTDIGTFREGQYIDDLLITDGYVCSCQTAPKNAAPFDFDGDGRTDASVFRPSDNPGEADFFVRQSTSGTMNSAVWGSVGDLPANADFDGDGRTDFAVFRPSSGTWFILRSGTQTFWSQNFGAAGDRLTPADFDGDGRADIAVFRSLNGTWFILRSSDGEPLVKQFGTIGDVPAPADFDGDGRADFAVFRPSEGTWFIEQSSEGFNAVKFGVDGDKPVPGDFDGDGRADFAIFRPSDSTWYLLRSHDGFTAVRFGLSDDIPLQADFDGDGRRDIAVYRGGNWFYLESSSGEFRAIQFGLPTDTPLPSIFADF